MLGRNARETKTNLLLVLSLDRLLGAGLLLGLPLLEESLRSEDLLLGGDGTGEDRLVRSPHTAVWNRAPVREL